MGKNRENPKRLPNRFCFSEMKSRVNLLFFSRLDADQVYLSGESRPSLAYVFIHTLNE
jgi:hypothetical protein